MPPPFELKLLPDLELQQINAEEGRYYQLPNGKKYMSVTRFVNMMDFRKQKALEGWKKRVGEQNANRKRDLAATRGTAQHFYCERYIGNDPIKITNPFHIEMYTSFKKEIDEHLGVVYGIEHRMYSDEFGLAGTTDVICEWDGKLSIVDFKTSANPKDERMIYGYYLQSSIYGHMAKTLHDLPIEQMVILIGVDNHPTCQTFTKPIDDYLEKVRSFHRENTDVLVY